MIGKGTDGSEVFVGPGVVLAPRERGGIAHFNWQPERTARTCPELQAGVGRAAAGDNRHHSPVAPTEDTRKCLFVDDARFGTVARMSMNPDSRELFRSPTQVDLLVEELGHGFIHKRHRDWRADLRDQDEFLNQQQIVGAGDPEPSHFGIAEITQEQQLGPRGRAEPECRSTVWWKSTFALHSFPGHGTPRKGNRSGNGNNMVVGNDHTG